LDLLQHHAAQYYASQHKIHELHERAMKSPSPQVGGGGPGGVSGPGSGSVGSSPVGSGPPGGPGGPGSGGLTSKPSSPSGIGLGIGIGIGVPPLGRSGSGGGGGSGPQKAADLSSGGKDTKPSLASLAAGLNESCRSPPTQHHVHSHTHHHTHVGISYPIIPTVPVPPQYSPHYTAAAATVIPPFPTQKPN
jgi:hypothetical protein